MLGRIIQIYLYFATKNSIVLEDLKKMNWRNKCRWEFPAEVVVSWKQRTQKE
jgi:hypothetical protein